MTPCLSASACRAARRMARSIGSSLAKRHNASRSAAEVSNGATNPQSSSWSRRLRPNAPASVAVFCKSWQCRRFLNQPNGGEKSSHLVMSELMLCANRSNDAQDPLSPTRATCRRLALFRHPERFCAAAVSSSSKRAAPALRGGEVARRVRWHAPASPGTALRDRPATSRARDRRRRDRREVAGRSRRQRSGTGPPSRCGGTISHPFPSPSHRASSPSRNPPISSGSSHTSHRSSPAKLRGMACDVTSNRACGNWLAKAAKARSRSTSLVPSSASAMCPALQHGIDQSKVARGEAVLFKLPSHDLEYPGLRAIGVRHRQSGVVTQRYRYQNKAVPAYGGVRGWAYLPRRNRPSPRPRRRCSCPCRFDRAARAAVSCAAVAAALYPRTENRRSSTPAGQGTGYPSLYCGARFGTTAPAPSAAPPAHDAERRTARSASSPTRRQKVWLKARALRCASHSSTMKPRA